MNPETAAGVDVESSDTTWVARAEDAIRSLREVENARIQLEGGEIVEIHVLTRSNKQAKHIVRDVQTVLQAGLKLKINHKVVSVAYLERDLSSNSSGNSRLAHAAASPETPRDVPASAPAPANSTPSTVPSDHSAGQHVEATLSAPPSPAAVSRSSQASETDRADRIRFGSVNLFVSGPRTQAQVELKWKGLPRMGSASGWSTRAGAHRLIAGATLAAVQEFLADDVALSIHEVEFLKLGRRRIAVVSLCLLAHRQEKILVGTCAVEQDAQQAVVLATLSGLNRVVGGLRTKELTEYVLRPTST